MKIVIDLPDEVVKWFKGKGFIPIGQYLTVDEAMKKAEPLSEVLDKISAEIKEEYDPTTEGRSVDDTYDSFHWGLRFCLEIIEKYKGVSE